MPKSSGPLPINSLATGLLKSQKQKSLAQKQNKFWAIFNAFFRKDNLYKLMDKNNNL
jgi:hypothetical protein